MGLGDEMTYLGMFSLLRHPGPHLTLTLTLTPKQTNPNCEHATMPSYSRLPAGTVYVSTAAAAATAVVAADSLSVQVPRPRHSEVYDG